uniref:G-protein-signaling modulator 1-like isoform X7 n=1 Tax=Pristiophorus japonicus TaxID=55135 RepID=UPI00398E6463
MLGMTNSRLVKLSASPLTRSYMLEIAPVVPHCPSDSALRGVDKTTLSNIIEVCDVDHPGSKGKAGAQTVCVCVCVGRIQPQSLAQQSPGAGSERVPFIARCSQTDCSAVDHSSLGPKVNRDPSDEECFFDLLSRFQSNRMDDQRCTFEERQNGTVGSALIPASPLQDRISQTALIASPQTEEFFDLIASSQSRRLDDQRANVGNLPGLRITHNNSQVVMGHLRPDGDPQEPGDEFFNMLMKCQSSRIDDQRCAPPSPTPRGPTVPDEDFFSLIQRVQAKRMDEQRVDLPSSREGLEQSTPGSS